MSAAQIHHFSPQRTPPEDLEAILVGRESLLDRTISKIRNSATTKNKHHRLFVGQRGIGKTHLVSLINHRVSQDKKLNGRIRIAWLNEDETSSRFLQLLVRIYRSLSARYPEEYPAEDLQSVMGTDPDAALQRLSSSLIERTGKRTILLLIENLDAYFAKFSVEEQRRWRGFIQDHPIFTMVATAQRLFDGIAKQDEPFYGFFDTHHLPPFSVEQTVEMLTKIATLNDDTDLLRILETNRGRSRLKVLHFLAGGNPRLYVLLAELIAEESLDDVVDAFEAMVDRQLTSFYQERLRWLAPLQQDIVQVLCRHRPAISVKRIAEELFTTNQSVSGQLKELRSFGYVRSSKDGRETRYELAEPLMRLVMQVKETDSRQPLRLLVEFLQAWFERQDLESRLTKHNRDSTGWRYLTAAVENYDKFLESWPMLDSSDSTLLKQADEFFQNGDTANAIDFYTTVIKMKDAPVDQVANALIKRGLAYLKQEDTEKQIADFSTVIELKDAPVDLRAEAFHLRGLSRGYLASTSHPTFPASSISDFTSVIKLKASGRLVAEAFLCRGFAYRHQADKANSINDFTAVIKMGDAPPDRIAQAFFIRSAVHADSGNVDLATNDLCELVTFSKNDLRTTIETDPSGFCSTVIAVLFASPQANRIGIAEKVLQRVTEQKIEDAFGQALIEQLSYLKDSDWSADDLKAWNQLWQQLGAENESLRVPLRLLGTGTDYLVTKKETSLLELPLEERRIIRNILGLDEST